MQYVAVKAGVRHPMVLVSPLFWRKISKHFYLQLFAEAEDSGLKFVVTECHGAGTGRFSIFVEGLCDDGSFTKFCVCKSCL